MLNSRSIAFFPARGGSKRIKNKNIKLFNGKPIISYPIEIAKNSKLFDALFLSTDSKKIKEVCEKLGVTAPFIRPKNISDDFSTLDDVILHFVNWLDNSENKYDYMCCILSTNPFLSEKYLKQGYSDLIKFGATTVMSVAEFSYPILRSLKVNKKNMLEMAWPDNYRARSQDLPVFFHDAAHFYWINIKKYRKERRLFSNENVPIIIPRKYVIDIDNHEDWDLAERLYKVHKSTN